MARPMALALIVALSAVAPATGQRPFVDPPSATEERFRHWLVYNDEGWFALGDGDLGLAEDRFRKAIESARPEAATDPRLLARSYADLAWVLHLLGRDKDAEPLARWALAVREQKLGRDKMPVGQTCYTLAAIELNLGHVPEAERLLERTLAVCEKALGADDPGTADALVDLATVCRMSRKHGRARALYDRALAIHRRAGDLAASLSALDGLAAIDEAEGRSAEAEARLKEVQALAEASPTIDPATLGALVSRRSGLLRKLGRAAEADGLDEDSRALTEGRRLPPAAPRPAGPGPGPGPGPNPSPTPPLPTPAARPG